MKKQTAKEISKKTTRATANSPVGFTHNIIIGNCDELPAEISYRLWVNRNGIKINKTMTETEYRLIVNIFKAIDIDIFDDVKEQ